MYPQFQPEQLSWLFDDLLRQLFGLERIEDTYFKLETMLYGVRHANYSNTHPIVQHVCIYSTSYNGVGGYL